MGYEPESRYWRWLLVPWKVATFAISTLVLVVAGPFTGDHDWDPGVTALMAVLTFATAPWAVGELWRRRSARGVYLAICVWLLSASWSFDLYWYVRRGFYPDSWIENLQASSFLYAAAGVLWNFESTSRGRWSLGFRAPDWPDSRPGTSFGAIAVPAILLMLVVGGVVLIPFFK